MLTALNRCSVQYAVTGAFALHQHTGIWYQTKDLDVSLTPEAVPRALECLRKEGYRCEVPDPVWLAKAHHGDFFVDLISGMSNGVLPVDECWIRRAHPAVIVGVPTRVLAPEELLASKIFVTRRERFDGADIAHILYGTKGKLDWNRLLQIMGGHWEMLLWCLVFFAYIYPNRIKTVPLSIWHDLLGRFESKINNPDPHARFRGSLVDEHLFAIDVREWGLEDQLADYRDRRMKQVAGSGSAGCLNPEELPDRS